MQEVQNLGSFMDFHIANHVWFIILFWVKWLVQPYGFAKKIKIIMHLA